MSKSDQRPVAAPASLPSHDDVSNEYLKLALAVDVIAVQACALMPLAHSASTSAVSRAILGRQINHLCDIARDLRQGAKALDLSHDFR